MIPIAYKVTNFSLYLYNTNPVTIVRMVYMGVWSPIHITHLSVIFTVYHKYKEFIKVVMAMSILVFCQFFANKNKRLKAKSGIIGEKLEKWVSENWYLPYFALQRCRYSTRIVTNKINQHMLLEKQLKIEIL